MSDYYNWHVDTLKDAFEFCRSYQSLRGQLIFRGQKNSDWELKSNLFRGNPNQEEVDNRIRKTLIFFQWCKENSRLPNYSKDQLFHIAQHYGMSTDLIDFSTSLEVAAFFALGAPRSENTIPNTQAAIFILDPVDLLEIPKLAETPSVKNILRDLHEITKQYVGAFQNNSVPGLSRLVAQDGVFIRDVGGTLEPITDPTFSLLPVVFEEEIGRPLLLKKVSFTPSKNDFNLLTKLGCTYDRIFPPPNDLEREIGRYFDLYSEIVYQESIKNDKNRVVVDVSRKKITNQKNSENDWNAERFSSWRKLNMSTMASTRPQSRVLETWLIPEDEVFDNSPSQTLNKYVEAGIQEGDAFKSRFELFVDSSHGREELPISYQTILESLISFPYNSKELELSLRMSLRLYLLTKSLHPGALSNGSNSSNNVLSSVFGKHEHWLHLDIICQGDGHTIKAILPREPLAKLESIRIAVKNFYRSDIGKQYGEFKDTGYGLYCMMFHKPFFRDLFSPIDSINLWARYVIPWQSRFGSWQAAILNPFLVEYIGLS